MVEPNRPRIALVGPCASGKSTLARSLRELGYEVREPAQEHSMVQDMWQRLTHPDILIFLDVTLETILARGRQGNIWKPAYLAEQHRRLAHAREHCDLYIRTDALEPAEILARVVAFFWQLTDK